MSTNAYAVLRAAAIGAALAGALVLSSIAGALYQTFAERADWRAFPPPGVRVQVGGGGVHLDCRGEGLPVVILEAGLTSGSTSWARVHDALAEQTRVCAYDRPGLDWSEPIEEMAGPAVIAQRLRAALDAAGIGGPYVLVGMSAGGVYVREYFAQFPEGVAGMVLICLAEGGHGAVGGTNVPLGVVLGLLGGFTYALYSWTARAMMLRGLRSSVAMGATFGLGGLMLMPVLLATGGPLLASWGNAAVGLYMAFVPMFLGYICFGYGLSRVRASTATTLTLIEPVVAALLATGRIPYVVDFGEMAVAHTAVQAVVTRPNGARDQARYSGAENARGNNPVIGGSGQPGFTTRVSQHAQSGLSREAAQLIETALELASDGALTSPSVYEYDVVRAVSTGDGIHCSPINPFVPDDAHTVVVALAMA